MVSAILKQKCEFHWGPLVKKIKSVSVTLGCIVKVSKQSGRTVDFAPHHTLARLLEKLYRTLTDKLFREYKTLTDKLFREKLI